MSRSSPSSQNQDRNWVNESPKSIPAVLLQIRDALREMTGTMQQIDNKLDIQLQYNQWYQYMILTNWQMLNQSYFQQLNTQSYYYNQMAMELSKRDNVGKEPQMGQQAERNEDGQNEYDVRK